MTLSEILGLKFLSLISLYYKVSFAIFLKTLPLTILGIFILSIIWFKGDLIKTFEKLFKLWKK